MPTGTLSISPNSSHAILFPRGSLYSSCTVFSIFQSFQHALTGVYTCCNIVILSHSLITYVGLTLIIPSGRASLTALSRMRSCPCEIPLICSIFFIALISISNYFPSYNLSTPIRADMFSELFIIIFSAPSAICGP